MSPKRISRPDHGSLYTVAEAADYLRVSERTVYRWMRARRLRAFRIGNVTRFHIEELERFVKDNTHPDGLYDGGSDD